MKRLAAFALAAMPFLPSPSYAAVIGISGVTLGNTPTTFNLGGGGFAFTYDAAAAAAFDPNTYSVQTVGTGQTSAFGGFLGIPLTPSLFDQRGITIDGSLFPSFASFPNSSPIPFSLVPGDLALRYSSGLDIFYGYARLNGDGSLNLAFENSPNTAITAGAAITAPLPAAVPEPSTWVLTIVGFGLLGAAMRRRQLGLKSNLPSHS